jgi:isoquinoline 1-oxidoreductase beta subunit
MNSPISRRDFLGTSAAGLTFALTLAADPSEFVAGTDAAEAPLSPNLWVTIGADDTITIVSPAAELGQGSFTSLPVILAEELDVDWSKVKLVQPPVWDPKQYGNPEYNGVLSTTASFAVRGYFKPMRVAGAQARRVLIDAAAAKWGVPADEVTTEPGVVVHKTSGRRMRYGEVAAFAKVPAELPKIEDKYLKSKASFRLIGKDIPRVELRSKVMGTAQYAMDVQVPGMVYAAALNAPYQGGAPVTVDDTRARQVAGITDVVRLPGGVGVIGTTVEATQMAKNLLAVTWSDAPGGSYDSERVLDEFAATARDKSRSGVDYFKSGDVASAMQGAARIMRAEFRTRHVYHAQMEPLNATAAVAADGKSAEVWVGTQGPSGLISELAGLLQTEPGKITVHQQWVGGGYGRRSQNEVVADAVRLSKAVGKPVKLIWSREDDIRAGKFRPSTAHLIEAGLDANGRIVAWHHRVVAESVANYMAAARGGTPPRTDQIVMKGSPVPMYAIPNKRAEHIVELRGARLAPLRGVGNAPNAFAIESFLDEIAVATNKTPLSIRLELCANAPRAAHLVRTVTEMSSWSRARDGRGLGLAIMEKDDTLAAGVAEVSVDRPTGKIKVHNFWAAIDAGIAVQPDNVEAQTKGSIIWALGHVLREQITIKNGHVQQSNFPDYEVIRMSDLPNIEVNVVSTDNRPTGAGEDGAPLVAAAVGNAIFALTGKRLFELPFSPDRVRGMLGA